ncbi:MAG: YabP/YqfC family sporulation protein [Clostridiales bacterium]|nr:YabP/YqfC family sporulation protein [Clostridiales bacterium]
MKKDKQAGPLLQLLEVPRELDPYVPRITLLGRSELLLENHGGILSYREDCARFFTGVGTLRVEGADLRLRQMNAESLFIAGALHSISFETEDN